MNPLSFVRHELSAPQMIDSCTKQFEVLKQKHRFLFEHPSINEMDSEATYPPMHDIDMDESLVRIVSTNVSPYLGTTGLSTCFAVAGKGTTPDKENFIGLAHINLISPKEVLERMTCAFRQHMCEPQSIEFYIIGGMLPYEGEGETDSSFEKQKVFLSLLDDYKIKAVRFNIVEGEIGALTVIMTENGALWTMRENVFNSACSFESSEDSSDTEDTSSLELTSDSVSFDEESIDATFTDSSEEYDSEECNEGNNFI